MNKIAILLSIMGFLAFNESYADGSRPACPASLTLPDLNSLYLGPFDKNGTWLAFKDQDINPARAEMYDNIWSKGLGSAEFNSERGDTCVYSVVTNWKLYQIYVDRIKDDPNRRIKDYVKAPRGW